MAEQTKDQLQALVTQLTTDLANSKNDLLNMTQERDSQRDALAESKQAVASLQQQLTDERTRSGNSARLAVVSSLPPASRQPSGSVSYAICANAPTSGAIQRAVPGASVAAAPPAIAQGR